MRRTCWASSWWTQRPPCFDTPGKGSQSSDEAGEEMLKSC